MICRCGNAIHNVEPYLADLKLWTCRECADRVQGKISSTAMTLCLIKRTKKKGQD